MTVFNINFKILAKKNPWFGIIKDFAKRVFRFKCKLFTPPFSFFSNKSAGMSKIQ